MPRKAPAKDPLDSLDYSGVEGLFKPPVEGTSPNLSLVSASPGREEVEMEVGDEDQLFGPCSSPGASPQGHSTPKADPAAVSNH